jgi:hypothetical protein
MMLRIAKLEFHYFGSLETLGAFYSGEFNRISFIKRFITIRLYCRMMHEYIIAGSRTDKSITLFIVEPLHCALFFHVSPI